MVPQEKGGRTSEAHSSYFQSQEDEEVGSMIAAIYARAVVVVLCIATSR
jgi:hypothetical protein